MASGPEPGSPHGWRLMRLDDNGNEFEIARFEDENAAQAMRQDYERKGHKQLYYVVATD
jgi:hypothetical protein